MLVVDSDRVESPGATPTLVGMAKRFLTRRVGGGGKSPGLVKFAEAGFRTRGGYVLISGMRVSENFLMI